MIKLKIHGEPKAQPRARMAAWKAAVDAELQNIIGKVSLPRSVGFGVKMSFCFKRPKSHYKKNGRLTTSAPKEMVGKPNCDNLSKVILDRVTRSEIVWKDDSQVIWLSVMKSWTQDESVTYVEIEQW